MLSASCSVWAWARSPTFGRRGSDMAERGTLALTDPDEVQERIEEYFQSRWATRKIKQNLNGKQVEIEEQYMRPPTMAGLALALDVTRTTLLFYGQGKGARDDRLIPIIARAKARIAEFAEEALYTREANQGAKFALEVNHGYGREDQGGGAGGGLEVNVIPPAEGKALEAIPKWQPEGDDDE